MEARANTGAGGSAAALDVYTGDGPTEIAGPKPLTPAYLKELAAGRLKPDQTRIYVSFRRETDERLARRLALKLAARFGEGSVVLGSDLLQGKRPFDEMLQAQLDPAWVVVVLVGPEWHRWPSAASPRLRDPGDPVRRELERTVELRAAGEATGRLPHVVPILREGVDVDELAAAMPRSLRPLLEEAGISEPDRGWTASEDLKIEARIQRLIAPLIERSTATTRPAVDTGRSNRLLVAALGTALLALVAALSVAFTRGSAPVAAPPAVASVATAAAPSGHPAADVDCDAHPYACVSRDLAQIRARLDELGGTPGAAEPAWDEARVARLMDAVGRIEATLPALADGRGDDAAVRKLSRELAGLRGDVGRALVAPTPAAAPVAAAPAPAVAPVAPPPPADPPPRPAQVDLSARWGAQIEAITATVCRDGATGCRSRVAAAMDDVRPAAVACLDAGGRDALAATKGSGRTLNTLPYGYRLVCRG